MASRLNGWVLLIAALVPLALAMPLAFVAGMLMGIANRLSTDARACFDKAKPVR